jgi:hypothetical protein
MTAKQYKEQIAGLENKVFNAEVLLSHAVNGAAIARKGNWRVLVRVSKRSPDIQEYAKAAIFQYINNEWSLWAFGEYPRLYKDIAARCDSQTEAGKEYFILMELMGKAYQDEMKRV